MSDFLCANSFKKRRRGRLAFVLLFVVSLIALQPVWPAARLRAQAEGRLYTVTGFTLAQQFVHFYDANGGIPLFGYPVTEAHTEGKYLVQWTERQRLEWHPENSGTPYEVQIGLLGDELTSGMEGPSFQASAATHNASILSSGSSPLSSDMYFPQTRQTVTEPFASYWSTRGGLPIFGYPVSSVFTDDHGLQVQWFERARFEYHPDLPDPYKVLLGKLGQEALKRQDEQAYNMQVFASRAPDSVLHVGLSQGGESEDPAFFDNVRQPGTALGGGLVRLDNIYSFYHVVQRGADGAVYYRWDDLDKVIDGVRAMGKEPFICLSYMPETLSTNGASRILPPSNYDGWGRLVKATVAHLNVERKLGIRYWEVWNEPNEWGFWQGSYPDYLRLYDTTIEAATAADPTVLVGGPSVSRLSPDHFNVFLQHEAALGDKGRVDFLSWHSYGRSPADLASDIREVREIASHYPQFKPEIVLSEFNVSQGGSGDTSANGYTDTVQGAIAFISAVESMQRERLDRAFLFELKDGQGPTSYWGRWGVLTNDGKPKPIYYALQAYENRPTGMLPVSLTAGPEDGSVGLMAFGGPGKASLILWYTGEKNARVKVTLPQTFAGTRFDLTLFDRTHNNPAVSGGGKPILAPWLQRDAGDLALDLQPDSLVLMTSR